MHFHQLDESGCFPRAKGVPSKIDAVAEMKGSFRGPHEVTSDTQLSLNHQVYRDQAHSTQVRRTRLPGLSPSGCSLLKAPGVKRLTENASLLAVHTYNQTLLFGLSQLDFRVPCTERRSKMFRRSATQLHQRNLARGSGAQGRAACLSSLAKDCLSVDEMAKAEIWKWKQLLTH